MDAKNTLLEALADFESGDYLEAAERLADYSAWRRSGGFEPTVCNTPGDKLADELAYAIEETEADL